MKRERYRSGEKALTKSQVKELLSVVTDIHDEALFRVAIELGLRREDLVNIQRKDVDLEGKTLTYYERKKRRTRTVPISQGLSNVLAKSLNVRRDRDSRVFTMSSKTAYNHLQKYLNIAGLPGRPIHALRATCIKLCQGNGWSAEQTAELVGDKVQTIQEHYLTPSKEEMREVMNERSII
jgi:integrase